jgi:hypothetical protein
MPNWGPTGDEREYPTDAENEVLEIMGRIGKRMMRKP